MATKTIAASAPAAWQIEAAMAQFAEARAKLLSIDATMPEDERLWSDTLDGIVSDEPFVVIDSLVEAALAAEAMAEAIAERRRSLALRYTRFEQRGTTLRQVILDMLTATELRKLERAGYTASVSARSHVVVNDLDALPPELKRVTVEARKIDIAAKLKAGEPVEGATMSNPAPSLTIRPR